MQVMGTKCAIVALNILALGKYGNKMSDHKFNKK